MKWLRRQGKQAPDRAALVCEAHEPIVDFDNGDTLSVTCRRCGQRILAPVDRILKDPSEDEARQRYSLN